MLLHMVTSCRGRGTQLALRPRGRRQLKPSEYVQSVGQSSFSSLSQFSVWHGASHYGSHILAPVKSKFKDLLISSSQKRFSSNSSTQPPSIQLDVNPDDPIASVNDQINKEIIEEDPKPTADSILGVIIDVVSEYKEDLLDESYRKRAVRRLLFKKYDKLPGMILDAWEKKDFKSIRTLRILQKTRNPNGDTLVAVMPDKLPTIRAFVNATEKSWNRDFIGRSASALWEHIMYNYMHHKKDKWYARYVAMVQSSGMGKSRTIDELSKTRLIIPLCLRPAHSTGYPYADDEVRDFLQAPQNEGDAHLHAMAFLLALFEFTATTLRFEFYGKTYSDVAFSFRQLMSSRKYPSKRQKFFCTVVANAKKYLYECSQSKTGTSSTIDSFLLKEEKMISCVHSAWVLLASLLATKYPSPDKGPILLLAWDEAQTLTEKVSGHHSWSHFIALRRVLRRLNQYPLFSIFSSTTNEISDFSPASASDTSRQVFNKELDLMSPFCDFDFDILTVEKVSVHAGQMLDQFTTDKYMCHLGRPEFGSIYDGDLNQQDNLLEYAAGKLVNEIPLPSELSTTQKIACLSFRLPIQFKSTVYTSRKHEEKLFKDHMRLCLKVDESREFMNTLSASEPFISEAAYFTANRRSLAEGRQVAVDAFKHLTEGFAVHSGDRGEFLAMLICTLARDSTVGLPCDHGRPSSRFFALADFLCNNLLQDTLASAKSKSNLQHLRLDFPHAVMHFNHFVKAHQQSVVNQENLLLLMARGAGFLCADSQPGFDIALPFLLDGLQMRMKNSGLLLAQVKNDSRYGPDVQEHLFKRMNPYQLHILADNQVAAPIIRIVFALASSRPSVHVIRHEPSDEYNAIIYDIWIAGITPQVLRPIDFSLQDTWKAALRASYGWKHLFDTTGPIAKNVRMAVDAASSQDDGHWNQWSNRGGNTSRRQWFCW